jgi:hypothetical protein
MGRRKATLAVVRELGATCLDRGVVGAGSTNRDPGTHGTLPKESLR